MKYNNKRTALVMGLCILIGVGIGLIVALSSVTEHFQVWIKVALGVLITFFVCVSVSSILESKWKKDDLEKRNLK